MTEATLLSAVIALIGSLIWVTFRITGRIDKRIQALNEHVMDHGKQIERIVTLCEGTNQRLDRIEDRLDRMDIRLDRIEGHVAGARERVARLEGAQAPPSPAPLRQPETVNA